MTCGPPRHGFRPGEDTGSGTVAALAIIFALLICLSLVAVVSSVSAASVQSARAADLAALAAADAARGLRQGDPCTVAEQVTARNGAALEACQVGGLFPTEVTVTVSREVSIGSLAQQLNLPGLRVHSSARAGPPEALP